MLNQYFSSPQTFIVPANYFSEWFSLDLYVVLPELFLVMGLTCLLAYGAVYHLVSNKTYFPASFSLLASELLFFTGLLIYKTPIAYAVILNDLYIHDSLSFYAKEIIIAGSIVCLLMSSRYLYREDLNNFEYSILILLATLGLLLMASAYDLLSLYLALELQSLSLYILAAYKKNYQLSIEAGLKYFILGALSTGFFLFGASLLYGATGSTHLEDFSLFYSNIDQLSPFVWKTSVLAIFLIITALLFKLGAAPFHMWLPDVYNGAPLPVMAYFAIVPKVAIVVVLARLLLTSFYSFIAYWQPVLIIAAVLSIVVGCFGGLYQKKVKKLIAYSAIAHMGYVLLGLSIGTPEGLQAVLLYTLVYIVMSIGFFSIYITLRTANTTDSSYLYITDFENLSKYHPSLSIGLAVILFSMAGIPPLAGFYSKLYLFVSAFQSYMFLPIAIALITSVVSTVYYIRLIKTLYYAETERSQSDVLLEIPTINALIFSTATFLTLFFFVDPSFLLVYTHDVALGAIL